MKSNDGRLALVLLALAAVGSAVMLGLSIFGTVPGRPQDARAHLRQQEPVKIAVAKSVAVPVGPDAAIRPCPRPKVPVVEATTNLNVGVKIGEDEIDELYERTVVELLSAIEGAIASHDHSRLRQLVDRYRQLASGSLASGGRRLSAATKRRLLDAFGGLGFDGLDLVIDNLGDPDPMIVSDATAKIFDMLRDPALGDYKRAEIVVAAAGEMSQRSSLVRLFNEFIRMRNSVSVEALSQIYSIGTPEAKNLLPRTMGAVTGNVETQTPQQLNEWLEQNPDPPEADRIYGPKEPRLPKDSTGGK